MASSEPAKAQKAKPPVEALFRFLQQRVRVRIWLYENPHTYIDGVIVGLDEFMNLVLKDATEVDVKKKTEASVGQIMLKGDNVTMVVAHQKDATRK